MPSRASLFAAYGLGEEAQADVYSGDRVPHGFGGSPAICERWISGVSVGISPGPRHPPYSPEENPYAPEENPYRPDANPYSTDANPHSPSRLPYAPGADPPLRVEAIMDSKEKQTHWNIAKNKDTSN